MHKIDKGEQMSLKKQFKIISASDQNVIQLFQ